MDGFIYHDNSHSVNNSFADMMVNALVQAMDKAVDSVGSTPDDNESNIVNDTADGSEALKTVLDSYFDASAIESAMPSNTLGSVVLKMYHSMFARPQSRRKLEIFLTKIISAVQEERFNKLEKEVETLRAMLELRPGNSGALAAQEHFHTLADGAPRKKDKATEACAPES